MTVNSPLASPKATIEALRRWGIVTQKSLGQHLLVDDGVVGRILRLACVGPTDRVLEVGPGIGTLTQALLLKGAQVLALEKDQRLRALLEDLQGRFLGSFGFEQVDALDYLRRGGAGEREPGAAGETGETGLAGFRAQKLVANLPYAVAATLVLDAFLLMPSIGSATVMVQKEVAQRMAARPGGKDYGAYSVKLQLMAEPKDSFFVNRSCFLPPPRVDSMVIRLDRRAEALGAEDIESTFMLVEAAFCQRRKTIRNSMRAAFGQQGLELGLVDHLLAEAYIDAEVRAETLEPQVFLALGRAFMAREG